MENISIFLALSAGVLSFFSPCVFPLIPAYVAHLTDGTVLSGKVNTGKKVLFLRSIGFILGFSIVFVLLGASASFIGQLFLKNKLLIQMIGGVLIVIFGLQMLGIFKIKFLMFEKRFEQKGYSKVTTVRSFLLGVAFGSGWTPCVGLALSSILLLASSSETIYSGMFLLWIYSLGLGIPFLILSIIVTHSLHIVKKINRLLPKLSLVNGLILIVMGILLFTGQMQKISAYLSAYTI